MNAVAKDVVEEIFDIDGKRVDLAGYRELLLGCGNRATKQIKFQFVPKEWQNVTRLDIDPHCKPDVLHDLNVLPLPFEDNTFNEIHAVDILEHTGQQGDWKFFFAQFSEFWRILKPGGYLIATSPAPGSAWAWGDPGHTRIMSREAFTFLCQPQYTAQVGKTPMTDYRHVYKADFDAMALDIDPTGQSFRYILKAVKPSRIT